MLSKWPIRNKLLIGIGLLLVIVATLSWSGFHGVYAYRSLVRSLSGRATELPLAADLSEQVSDLRVIVGEVRGARRGRRRWRRRLLELDRAMASSSPTTCTRSARRSTNIASSLLATTATTRAINDSRGEWETVHKIDASLERIVDGRRATAAGSPTRRGWKRFTSNWNSLQSSVVEAAQLPARADSATLPAKCGSNIGR